MFILCNQSKKILKSIRANAQVIGTEAREFTDGCFQDTKGEDLPLTEVTFIAHGSRYKFGGNTEECINGYSPKEFVAIITDPQGARKLPITVKTLQLVGCQIGLIQPPTPSYIALVAEELAKRPGYEEVVIYGFQFEDLDKNYAYLLLEICDLDTSKKDLLFNYHILTQEQNRLRLKHKEKVSAIENDITQLKHQLKEVKNQLDIWNSKNGRAELIEEKKAIQKELARKEKDSKLQEKLSNINIEIEEIDKKNKELIDQLKKTKFELELKASEEEKDKKIIHYHY